MNLLRKNRAMSDVARANGQDDGAFGRPWWIYRGTGLPQDDVNLADRLLDPPHWRRFDGSPVQLRPPDEGVDADRRLGAGRRFAAQPDEHEGDMINAALLLRRPLLVTGAPGTGKSTLAYQVARELRLGRVLHWAITSRTTLSSGLYGYDAIGRAQAAAARDTTSGIGDFVRLGPLGTALLAYELPRVLLIDELDKSDIDLPNDLLHVFEEGEFEIPELVRLRDREREVTVFTDDPARSAVVVNGRVRCKAFPFVVITSNKEREFPPAFLRRCLRLEIAPLREDQLAAIVAAHFGGADAHGDLIRSFLEHGRDTGLAADQLLNAVYLATSGAYSADASWLRLLNALWQELTAGL
jgi:MoxR-like ATPase